MLDPMTGAKRDERDRERTRERSRSRDRRTRDRDEDRHRSVSFEYPPMRTSAVPSPLSPRSSPDFPLLRADTLCTLFLVLSTAVARAPTPDLVRPTVRDITAVAHPLIPAPVLARAIATGITVPVGTLPRFFTVAASTVPPDTSGRSLWAAR